MAESSKFGILTLWIGSESRRWWNPMARLCLNVRRRRLHTRRRRCVSLRILGHTASTLGTLAKRFVRFETINRRMGCVSRWWVFYFSPNTPRENWRIERERERQRVMAVLVAQWMPQHRLVARTDKHNTLAHFASTPKWLNSCAHKHTHSTSYTGKRLFRPYGDHRSLLPLRILTCSSIVTDSSPEYSDVCK